MAKERDTRPRLSFAQANAICREFLSVGDQVFETMKRLREANFKAFLPRHRFIESFAATPKELDLHRQCVVENAKELVACPWPMRVYDEDFKQLYFSPLLEQLREERD